MSKVSLKKDKVNWIYQDEEITDISQTPNGSFSFVYKITLEDGRYYYGKKFMWKPKYTSGKNKGISKGEYPWKTYNGSSKELIDIIKSGVKYKKEIIMFCYSKAETSLQEAKLIVCNSGLEDNNCFNRWISLKVWEHQIK